MKLSHLKALIKEVIKEELTTRAELDNGVMHAVNVEEGKEEEDEQSGSGAAGGFQTPFAFKKKTNEISSFVAGMAGGAVGAFLYRLVKDLVKKWGANAKIDEKSVMTILSMAEKASGAAPGSTEEWHDELKGLLQTGKIKTLVDFNNWADEKIKQEKGLKEMTGTGAVAGYQTPFAFSKNKSGSKRAVDATKKLGYKVVGPSPRV